MKACLSFGGDSFIHATILNFTVQGSDYSREAILQGTAIILGNTVV